MIDIAYGNNQIKTVANIVTEQLREDIINGVYKAGEHITFNEIAQKYNVSLMPVREAFQCLKGEGLLEIKQYKGACVHSLSDRDVKNIYDIRRVMEQLIMSEVIQKDYGEEFLGELEAINQTMDLSQNLTDLNRQWQEVNNQFHYHMFSLCDNTRARDMYTFYSDLFKALKKQYPNSKEEIVQSMREHEEIIQALRERDGEALTAIIEHHANRSKENALARLESFV